MSGYTSFKIGGPCRLMIFPKNMQEIMDTLMHCKQQDIPVLFMGNGSNMLVSDAGYDGVVVKMTGEFSDITKVDDCTIFARSGATLSKLCHFARRHALTGLECCYGIPASVGGSVYMNAGAYGGEIKDVIQAAEYVDMDGKVHRIAAQDLQMSYRHSFFTGKDLCITGAYFKLKPGDPKQIKARMNQLYDRRKTKQPLEYPSAGSTFKRPDGAYAAQLIQECGLKGVLRGGAQVSEKHSGFIINTGGATCHDVLSLIKVIQQTVKQKTDFCLECEVKIIG